MIVLLFTRKIQNDTKKKKKKENKNQVIKWKTKDMEIKKKIR